MKERTENRREKKINLGWAQNIDILGAQAWTLSLAYLFSRTHSSVSSVLRRKETTCSQLCPALRSMLTPKGRRPHHLLTLRMPRMKSEAEARTLTGETTNRAKPVSHLRTTSLTHRGLKQGRKETHHEPQGWWTEQSGHRRQAPGTLPRVYNHQRDQKLKIWVITIRVTPFKTAGSCGLRKWADTGNITYFWSFPSV